MRAVIKSLQYCIDRASKPSLFHAEVNTDFIVEVNGESWHAYSASITYQDILLYCDKGTVTYVVDIYGDRSVAELFDYEVSA